MKKLIIKNNLLSLLVFFIGIGINTVNAQAVCSTSLTLNGTISVGDMPTIVKIADFNNDGNNDIITVNSGSFNVSIVLGDGSGNFGKSYVAFTQNGYEITSLLTGDFDKDGNQDIVLGSNYLNSIIYILKGKGDGSFLTTIVPFKTDFVNIAVGDFNDDGKLDLAVAERTNPYVDILLGNGNATFTMGNRLTVATGNRYLEVNDFNNDGKDDLVSINGDELIIHLGVGGGNFTNDLGGIGGNDIGGVSVGDYNNDNNQDIALLYSSGFVGIRVGDGKGSFSHSLYINLDTRTPTKAIGSLDFNGDGLMDLVTLESTYKRLSVFILDGTGNIVDRKFVSVGNDPRSLAIGDFNKDSRSDIIVVNAADDNASILLASNGVKYTVKGAGVLIQDGDLEPSLSDLTDFGSMVSRTYTI